MNGGPLHGLRVLDLTQFLSGPYGAMILGDLGADVVKVEPPSGELARTIPPHFVAGDSTYYLSINRNKRSVVADLKTAEGLRAVKSLALAADIVIENFRPGVLARLGLRYEELALEKPALIWCSISGFGQSGPWRDWPAYDMVIQALSGGMSLTGQPGGEPVRAGIPLADLSAGMFGVIGVLAALHECRASGKGRWVDIAMLDCQLSMLSYQAAAYLHSGMPPGPQGSAHDSIPTYRSFVAGDGARIVVNANTEDMWCKLAGVLGRADLCGDARFGANAERFAHRHALWPELEAAFLTRPAAQWMRELIAAGVPAGVVNTLDDALGNEQAQARGMVLQMRRDDGAGVATSGNPVKFMGHADAAPRCAPALGAHTREVLGEWLGEHA